MLAVSAPRWAGTVGRCHLSGRTIRRRWWSARPVNRLCSSGLSAIIQASQMIKSGAADVVIAGGVESMSRAPWVQEKPATAFAKPGAIFDTSIGWRFANPKFHKGELSRDGKMTYSMPETAEEVARVDSISREDADAVRAKACCRRGLRSDRGQFVLAERWRLGHHRGVRGSHTEARLTPRRGLSTALPQAANLKSWASARSGHAEGAHAGVGDLGAVELNEAFATQSLACVRRLGLDPETVNNDGGAIALGYPLGSSGSRIAITLLGRMEREDAKIGLATMCIGVGQGTAMLLERV